MKHINLYRRDHKNFWSIIFFIMAAVTLSTMSGQSYATALTQIKISSSVTIDAENILLGRIAEIQGDDPLLVKKLSDIVIGRLPLPGQSREFEEDFFKMRLKQNGCDLTELVLQLPPKVVVTRNFIEISKEKTAALVSNLILKNLSSYKGDVKIKEIQVAENLRLPQGHITYKVTPLQNTDLMGKIPFAVDYDVDGKFQKRVWATATVEVLTDVVVTRKPLGRFKPLTEDDIILQKMDLANLPSNVITDFEEVLGKRTRRAIGAKTILRADLIELPPLVNRGDMVVIIAESEGLRITARGQVKKKGRLGERIPVINFDSKKVLYALVIDSSTVKVEF